MTGRGVLSCIHKVPSGHVVRPRRIRRRSPVERRRTRTALAFLAPALTVISVFVLWPMGTALRTSFTDARILGDVEWVGADNYVRLVSDDRFTNALANSALYAVVTTPVSVGLALAFALLLNRALPLRGLFRGVLFLPFVVSLGIVAIAWAFVLDPQVGLVNHWLAQVGLSIGDGVRDPAWAMPAVMLVGVWRNVGFFMVMYLAGLQSIPREMQEAAVIDGAGPLKRFRYVTWPLLSNTTMFVMIIASIFAFQAFDQMFVMTAGGPFFRTETLVLLIYRTGFANFEMGYASAMSWVLVLIILVLSMAQIAYFRRRVVRY
jgi:ABC-type sugar transport system permease subunit